MGGRGAAGERVRMAAVEGSWVRRRNDIAQPGRDGTGDREKMGMLGRFRKALAGLVPGFGKKAANQKAELSTGKSFTGLELSGYRPRNPSGSRPRTTRVHQFTQLRA